MPYPQSAPAAPGNQAPLQVPSLRRPTPANTPRTPRPINRHQAKVPYPELPPTPRESNGTVTPAEFDRAWFLRQLAQWRAADKLLSSLYTKKLPNETQLLARMFMCTKVYEAANDLREAFDDWMQQCGGMAGPGFVAQ